MDYDSAVQELRACIAAETDALDLFMAEVNVAVAPKLLFGTRLPRLDIIVYAIRFLLARQDSPGFEDVPSLLDFATTLEVHRKLMIEKVEEANATLTHHEKLSGENVLCWDEYRNSDSIIRAVYTELISQYCAYVSYLLCTRYSAVLLTVDRTSTVFGQVIPPEQQILHYDSVHTSAD